MKNKNKIFLNFYSPSTPKERGLGGEVWAFTLVELLVWISISIVLMMSVTLFVSSWMKNIADEQKILQNSWEFSSFSFNLQNTVNHTGSWKYLSYFWSWETLNVLSSTWVLFKRNQYFWKWGFSYIWELEIDWEIDTENGYCFPWSEDTKTNHLIIKNFVPFEEQWEDMFNDWYDVVFTWGISDPSNTYISDTLNHVIYKDWDIIIWKWVYWDKFREGDFWTWVYLNNPTWLALSWSTHLFVSDTLNNRVLYYNITAKTIHKLLDETDWLLEPTGLYYNSW